MKFAAKVQQETLSVEIERIDGNYRVSVDGDTRMVDARKVEGEAYSLLEDGASYDASVERIGDGYRVRYGAIERIVTITDPSRKAREARQLESGPLKVLSAMPGKVVRILVEQGQSVAEGDGLVVVEAMKMENQITAPRDGVVRSLDVAAGQAVEGGATLAVIE